MKKFFKIGCLGIIGLVVLLIIAVVAFGGGDDTAKTSTPSPSKETSTSGSSEAADEAPAEPDSKIEDGTYKIGTDIEAGEYLVVSDGMTYVESAKDSTGELESIVFNETLMDGGQMYVTIEDGEYFKLQGGNMYPIADAPSNIPEDGIYKDGMYKVGQDIPAGEYKVIVNDETGMGYYEVSKNSRHSLESIITNEVPQADDYLTVSDGQYLTLQGVSIEK